MKVLVVEDEWQLASRLAEAFRASGLVVESRADGEEGYALGAIEPFDAIVLDLGLPKLDGMTVLARWRSRGIRTPVLILTARARWSEKLAGFNAGADDYLTKPFELDEAVVRVRALIRRAYDHATAEIACGPLRLDTANGKVSVRGAPLQLTAQEFRILEYLMHQQGKVVSRLQIIDHVYDRDFDRDSNVIDVLIGRIRRKLGANLIHTIRGRGYRLALLESP